MSPGKTFNLKLAQECAQAFSAAFGDESGQLLRFLFQFRTVGEDTLHPLR